MALQPDSTDAGHTSGPAGFGDHPQDSPADDLLQRPASGTPGAGVPDIDPELEADLGDELAFRGDTVEAELEAARAEATECRDLALRVQAEFDNYRKRVSRDQQDMVNRAGERIISEVLPVLDNLERAIDHVTAGGDVKQLLSGVEGVHRQLLDVLVREGVTRIDPFGAPFDPMVHQAMAQREDPEVAEGTVVEVYQKGYEMHGRIIRPAMVVVATGSESSKE